MIDGEIVRLSVAEIKAASVETIQVNALTEEESKELDCLNQANIDRFIAINSDHLSEIELEAIEYIKEEAALAENIAVSFSGGKDSTATSALVMQALGREDIQHIFADTTLEFDSTYEYVEEYKKLFPHMPFASGKNEEDFYKAAEEIGAPARKLRWCCTMYKTGVVNRLFESLFDSKEVLTFYGVRKSESSNRSKYNRTEDRENASKVTGQRLASPIFHWKDCDVWLYILAHQIPFNAAYRQGALRAGCFNCPNSSTRGDFLVKVYMPEKSKRWYDFLHNFAESLGKNKDYINDDYWKWRQGGNGMKTAADVKVKQTNCTTEENAKVYELNKPLDDWFYDLFRPFGIVSKTLDRKLIGEVLVLDVKTKMPIISIQPFKSEYEHSVKIMTLNVQGSHALQRKIKYQIVKYNACKRCLKCEAVCKTGAITIRGGIYAIDDNKCTRCHMCVTSKYLEGGCLMTRYLRTSTDYNYE